MTWDSWLEGETRAIRAAGQWRAPRDVEPRMLNFASNDYLGLTQHASVVAAAHAALDNYGSGSGSARLIVGSRPIHGELERALAEWKAAPRAALFPTGFATNLGVLTTFGGPGVLICSDELNHASIIDGCRLAPADVVVYRHNDLDHLAAALRDRGARRALVVSDTVFSMDGDLADVPGLADLCAREHALLVLDEAHAVLGPHDAPVNALRVGTLSKTLGSLGGFVAGPTRAIELIENRARPYIFTTAPTPADTAAAVAALGILRSPEGDALVARLRTLVDRVRPGHPSPIVPFVVGEETAALAAADALRDRGIVVPAIRPPTVAPGTSRLRVTLSAAHTDDEVATLQRALAELLTHAAMTVVVVTGTGTEIGKTYVTAALTRALGADGVEVHARKPVQSFAEGDAQTDADVLAAASGEPPHDVCPEHRWLPIPMAPPMAADALGLEPFTIMDLVEDLHVPASGVTLVESAGGILSPLAIDGDTCDLVVALAPALVVVVADAELGTINLVRMTLATLGDTPALVFLNRYDETQDLHRRNADWLRNRENLEIATDIADLRQRVLGAQPL